MPPIATATAWLWLITSRRQFPHPPPAVLHFCFTNFVMMKAAWANDWVFVDDPSRAATQSNSAIAGAIILKRSLLFQGRYDCSWHMGSDAVPAMIRVDSMARLHLFEFQLPFFEFMPRHGSLSSCPVKHTFVYNPGTTYFFKCRGKMSCLPSGCHFFLWKEAPLCHDAVSEGQVLFSDIVLKMQGKL